MIRKIVIAALCLATSVFGQAVGGGGVPGAGGGGGNLPAATAANQTLYSTGVGTTYAASQPANLLNFPLVASATTPLYLVGHFRDDTQQFFLSYSSDAKDFVQLNATAFSSFLPTGGVRDIGAVYVPAQHTFYFTGTCCNNGTFWYWTSTDLQTFSAGTAITTGVGAGNTQWSPHIFLDTQSGNYYAVVGGCASACSTATDFYLATFTPATGVFGTFNHITMSGEGGTTGLFDARIYWDAAQSLYYMVYTSQTAGPTQYIHLATSSTIGGTYTRIDSGTTDFFGFTSASENPDVAPLPNGNLRVYADVFATVGSSRFYTRQWVDSTANFASVIGTPAQVSGPEQEGGTSVTITDPAVAAVVYSAAAAQSNPVNSLLSGYGINGAPNAAYSIFLGNYGTSSYPNAFNTASPAAIGFQASNGNIASISSSTTSTGTICIGTTSKDCAGTVQAGAANLIIPSAGASGGMNIDETAQTNGKKWSAPFVQAGVLIFSSATDVTTPEMMISVPTTFANLVGYSSNTTLGWNANSQFVNSSLTLDTGISRNAADTVSIGNGTQGDHTGRLLLGGLTMNGGTVPTVTGCGTITSQLGGTSAGSFVTSTTGTCTAVLTGLKTVADGYTCIVTDQTTHLVLPQSANSTSSCTVTGTTAANDVIVFTAIGW